MIAPVGDDIEVICIRWQYGNSYEDYLPDSSCKNSSEAESFERKLERFRILLELIEKRGTVLEGTFGVFAGIMEGMLEVPRESARISWNQGLTCEASRRAISPPARR